jgi:hypothetical protein
VRAVGLGVVRVDSGVSLVQKVTVVRSRSGLVGRVVVVGVGRAVAGCGTGRAKAAGVVRATETAVIRVNSGIGAVAQVRRVRTAGVVRAVTSGSGVRAKTTAVGV